MPRRQLVIGFVIVRSINHYGDPQPWRAFPEHSRTLLSFLNITKYPSLLFLLMTLGPLLLLLRIFDGGASGIVWPAIVFGRVPMFYYLLHIPLIHSLTLVICYLRYGAVHWIFESPTLADSPFTPPTGWGISLTATYLMWALVVALLYPVCRWFAAVKQPRRDVWLSLSVTVHIAVVGRTHPVKWSGEPH